MSSDVFQGRNLGMASNKPEIYWILLLMVGDADNILDIELQSRIWKLLSRTAWLELPHSEVIFFPFFCRRNTA